jgi:hypothetical protein
MKTVAELRDELDSMPDDWEVRVAVLHDGGALEFREIDSLAEEVVYGPRNIVVIVS